MTKNKLGFYQIFILTFFFTRSLISIGFLPNFVTVNPIDNILSMLLAFVLGLIILNIYLKLLKHIPKELPNTKKKYLLIIPLILILTLFASYLTNNTANFIKVIFLPNESLILIILLFLFLSFYLSRGKIESIARTAQIFFYIFLILLLLVFVGMIPVVNKELLMPLYSGNIKKLLQGTIMFGTGMIIPFFFLIFLKPYLKEDDHKNKKAIISGYIVAFFSIFLFNIITIASLGTDLTMFYHYPEAVAFKKIVYFNFIERLEGVYSLIFLFDSLVLLSFILYTLSHLLNLKNKYQKIIYFIIVIIIFLISLKINFNPYFIYILLLISIIFLILSSLINKRQKKKV